MGIAIRIEIIPKRYGCEGDSSILVENSSLGTIEGYVGGVYWMYNPMATSTTERKAGAPIVGASHVASVFEFLEQEGEDGCTPLVQPMIIGSSQPIGSKPRIG